MKSENPIRIIIADDHEIFRDGFAGLMKKQHDIVLVGQAANGEELIRQAEELKPDVILTDISMPVMDGIEATKQLIGKSPAARIIALTMFNDDHYVLDMLDAGAQGYLLKNTHKVDIIEAIHAVHQGKVYYSRETSMKLMHLMAAKTETRLPKPDIPDFTMKETEIITLLCRQLSNKQISNILNLSTRTIEGYRIKIQTKMGVHNAVGIAVYAIKHKLVEL